jgi:hypothetical protein
MKLATLGLWCSFLISAWPSCAANIVVWGEADIVSAGVPSRATNIVALSTTETHTVALRGDGTVVDWPNVAWAPSVLPPVGLHDITAVATGWGFDLALKRDGTVTGWGNNLSLPSGVHDIVAIAAGSTHGQRCVVGWGIGLATLRRPWHHDQRRHAFG